MIMVKVTVKANVKVLVLTLKRSKLTALRHDGWLQ